VFGALTYGMSPGHKVGLHGCGWVLRVAGGVFRCVCGWVGGYCVVVVAQGYVRKGMW
jgi:hypothetical protein